MPPVHWEAALRIIVAHHRYNPGGQTFSATLEDGTRLCTGREPFFAAARVLQLDGVSDDTVLELWRVDGAAAAMTGRVGDLAGMTVSEGSTPPRIVPFTPFGGGVGDADEIEEEAA